MQVVLVAGGHLLLELSELTLTLLLLLLDQKVSLSLQALLALLN